MDLQFDEMLDLGEALAEACTSGKDASLEALEALLEAKVFLGLKPIRTRFDAPSIRYFTGAAFLKVVERCTSHHVQVIGVEVFTRAGRLVDVEIAQSGSNAWCADLVRRHQDWPALLYSATYLGLAL